MVVVISLGAARVPSYDRVMFFCGYARDVANRKPKGQTTKSYNAVMYHLYPRFSRMVWLHICDHMFTMHAQIPREFTSILHLWHS